MPVDGSRKEVRGLDDFLLDRKGIPDPPEIEEDPMPLEEMDLQEDLEVPDPPDLDRLAETQHE